MTEESRATGRSGRFGGGGKRHKYRRTKRKGSKFVVNVRAEKVVEPAGVKLILTVSENHFF